MADEDKAAWSATDGAAMLEMIKHFSDEFASLRQERHKAGAAEYGAFTFLGNDVVRMMAEELADTANYCEMQFIKLMILNKYLTEHVANEIAEGDEITIGLQAFKGTKEGWNRGR